MNMLKERKHFFCGFIFLSVLYVFLLIKDENVIVFIHDQLDDAILTYILKAEQIKLDNNPYERFLIGTDATSRIMPAPGCVLFYLFFSPCYAYIVNIIFVSIVSYVSMYSYLKFQDISDLVAMIVSVLYASVPTFSVYGLSIMGIPLIFVSFYLLKSEKKKKNLLGWLCVCLYGFFSALILIGYMIIGIMILATIVYGIQKNKKLMLKNLLSILILIVIYSFTNFLFIFKMFVSGEPSHREEFVISSSDNFLLEMLKVLIQGGYHAGSVHPFILVYIIGIISMSLLYSIKKDYKFKKNGDLIKIEIGLGIVFFIAFFKALFVSPYIVEIRNEYLGVFKTLQLDRIFLFYPFLFYSMFALAIKISKELIDNKYNTVINKSLTVFCVCGTFLLCVAYSSLYRTIGRIRLPNILAMTVSVSDNEQITWKQFFATDLYEEIEISLNGDKSGYKVMSIGMHPSVALYNGYYCLDGYSNYYPIKHKYDFYEIIKEELELDNEKYKYFMEWGSRCYAFSHEIDSYVISKDSGLSIKDFRYNLDAFTKLGGRYIFSAVEIQNAETYGMKFVGSYSNQDSFYNIRVYEVGEN